MAKAGLQMGAKSAADVIGFEFDWLGSDTQGQVALFSTAGGGYVPESFLRDTDAHDVAIDAILALPVSTAVRFSPELPGGLMNTWHLVAERGLFAFESDPHGGLYRLIAAPVVSVRVADLPPLAAAVARLLRVNATFSSERGAVMHIEGL